VRPFFHAHQSKAAAVTAHGVEVESLTVISHGQLDVVVRSRERDREQSRCAVCEAVSERFLRYSKQTHRNMRVQVLEVVRALESDLSGVLLFDLPAVRLDDIGQAE